MDAQDFRSLQEAYMEVVMGEGRVSWDDPKNPNPSGLTPKEKSKAKRKQLGVDDPNKPSFEKGGPGENEYARHAKLAGVQDKMNNPFKRPKGNLHKFNFSKYNQGYRKRLLGVHVPKDKRSSYEPEKKNKNSPNFRKRFSSESYDLYDIILSHLLDEGYAETPEAAQVIMVNMSEEWRQSILG